VTQRASEARDGISQAYLLKAVRGFVSEFQEGRETSRLRVGLVVGIEDHEGEGRHESTTAREGVNTCLVL